MNSKPNALRRKALFAALALAFVIQSTLIYLDPIGRQLGRLSTQAQLGREVWNKNNCQTCHQLYGQGGHLGPDLTNLGAKIPALALDAILKSGPKQMPVYSLRQNDTLALHQYFIEIDQTGTSPGQPVHNFSQIPWFELSPGTVSHTVNKTNEH